MWAGCFNLKMDRVCGVYYEACNGHSQMTSCRHMLDKSDGREKNTRHENCVQCTQAVNADRKDELAKRPKGWVFKKNPNHHNGRRGDTAQPVTFSPSPKSQANSISKF